MAICPTCKREFELSERQKRHLKIGETKQAFCSHSCYSKSLCTREIVKCAKCNVEFMPSASQWWWHKNKNKNIFCSLKCAGAFYSGDKNNKWNGGRCEADTYIKIKTEDGYEREHRYIAEKTIGRKLKQGEIVHHINGDKKDNRPENLTIMTNSAHVKMHAIKQWANMRAVNKSCHS